MSRCIGLTGTNRLIVLGFLSSPKDKGHPGRLATGVPFNENRPLRRLLRGSRSWFGRRSFSRRRFRRRRFSRRGSFGCRRRFCWGVLIASKQERRCRENRKHS